jgi:hypothetical protein
MIEIPENLTMPSGAERSRFDVAIPGQSLTKEPKSYPWESAPMFTTNDEVMDYYFDRFDNDDTLFGLFAMLESGIPVTTIVTSMIMHGFSEGMYTPDLGILVGEDIAMLIMAVAEEAGIDYKIGEKTGVSNAIKNAVELKQAIKERDETFMPEVEEKIEELKVERSSGGLIAPTETVEEVVGEAV